MDSVDTMTILGILLGCSVLIVGIINVIPISEMNVTIIPVGGMQAGNNIIVSSDGTSFHTHDFGKYVVIMKSNSCEVKVTKNLYDTYTIKDIARCE